MLENYLNLDGFVTIKQNAERVPGEGNGFLQTGLAAACDIYPGHLGLVIGQSLEESRLAGTKLFYRSPHKKNSDDFQAADDWWGILALCKFFRWDTIGVLGWAEDNEWNFDIQYHAKHRYYFKPEYRFDRYFSFAPLLKLTSMKPLTTWDHVLVCIDILADCFKRKADGHMKTKCKVWVYEKTWQGLAVSIVWHWAIRKRYGSLGKSWEPYFGGENSLHPLVLVK